MKCVIILKGLLRFDEGTQCEINNGSKKCVLVMANLKIQKPQMQNHFSL
jgi:hypothetical protein